MVTILGFLARLSVILGFGGIIFTGISDLILKTNYLEQFDDFLDLGSPRVKIILVLVALAYLLVFLLSYLNKWLKYSQNRKIKNKNGEIEVTLKTINDVAKDFLNNQEIIKNSKVKSYASGRAAIVEVVVDTYTVDNLNEKLSKIQEELSSFVFNATGITVKKSKIKLKKVVGETIIEKKVIKESVQTQKTDTKSEENKIEVAEVEETTE